MRYQPFRNLGVKLLSIGIAVLLWLVVSGEQIVDRGLRVPLELQNFPQGLELRGEPPATVDIRVRGSSGTLARLTAADSTAVLDVAGAKPGRRLFHVTTDQVRTPFGVEVVQVSPATLALTFEPTATRRLPIVPSIEGEAAPGYVTGKMSVEPASVEVTGPESAVRSLTEAMTEPVSIAGATQPIHESVTIGVADPVVRLTTARTAAVTIDVLPAPVERLIRNVPVHLRNVSSSSTARAVPPVVGVSVRGERDALRGLEADSLTLYVDLAGLGTGQYFLPVRMDPTHEFGVIDIDPSTVEITIK